MQSFPFFYSFRVLDSLLELYFRIRYCYSNIITMVRGWCYFEWCRYIDLHFFKCLLPWHSKIDLSYALQGFCAPSCKWEQPLTVLQSLVRPRAGIYFGERGSAKFSCSGCLLIAVYLYSILLKQLTSLLRQTDLLRFKRTRSKDRDKIRP